MQKEKKGIERDKHLSVKVPIVMMVFGLLSIIFYSVSAAYINNNYESILSQTMSQGQKAVDDFFNYPENIINILSGTRNSDLAAYEPNERQIKTRILSVYESIVIADSRISNIYYIPNDGEPVVFDYKKEINSNLTKTSWFQKAVEGKTQIIWISHKSDFSDEEVISCLQQVLDQYGNPIGVVGLDIKLFKISEIVESEKKGNRIFSMILDDDHNIIAHTDHTYLGEHIPDANLKEDTNGAQDRSSVIKIKGRNFKCRVVKLEKLPWKMIYAVPVSDIMLSVVKWTVLFAFISVIGFGIVLILINANEKLKAHAAVIEELAVSKERNRLARDIHDTLGHTMTILISMLEIMNINFYKEPEKTKEMSLKAADIAREGLKELRQSISGIAEQKAGRASLVRDLRNLMVECEQSGVKIDFIMDEELDLEDPMYSDVIYRCCQEAVTNALRHGKARGITIILQESRGKIKLFIFDDGVGCKKIKKGYGLQGMEERIGSLKGSIVYGSDGKKGFNINVELPIKEQKML